MTIWIVTARAIARYRTPEDSLSLIRLHEASVKKAIKDGRCRVSDRHVSLGCEEHVVEEADHAGVKLINEEGN